MRSRNVATRIAKTADSDLIPLDSVRAHLALVWLSGSAFILIIVIVQSLMNHYGNDAEKAWEWLLPTITPTLALILSVLGYSALDPKGPRGAVRKTFYRVALSLSVFYLLLILLSILIQPFTGIAPIELMQRSNLWLGPVQGLVASALGVLFASKRPREEQRPGLRS